jgi:hypothetical protein
LLTEGRDNGDLWSSIATYFDENNDTNLDEKMNFRDLNIQNIIQNKNIYQKNNIENKDIDISIIDEKNIRKSIDDENIDKNLIFDEKAWSDIKKLIDTNVLPKNDVYTICRYVIICRFVCIYSYVCKKI